MTIKFNKEIAGIKLKKARNEKGYTQEQLSEIVGISNRTLNLMEKGKSGMIIDTLLKFCDALLVSPNYLLNYTSDNNDIIETLEKFTPKQKELIKEFLKTFEKIGFDI